MTMTSLSFLCGEWCCSSVSQSVQSVSHIRLFATPWTAPHQNSLSSSTPSLLKLMHRVGDAIQPSHPLLSPSLPAFNLSQHQGFFHWVISLCQVAKVLEFQLQHLMLKLKAETIFRIDFLLVGLVWSPCSPRDSQESSPTLQFKSINSSVLSFLYSPTLTSIHDYWKTIGLTRRTFIGKIMSLLFTMLSRFVVAFIPRSKRLLISWLQSPSAVILELPKINSVTVSIVSPSICHEVVGPMPWS